MGDTVAKKETEKKAKKEKKEKKFNSDRVGRNVKAALKAVFPNESFVVSSLVEKIEVLYPSASKIAPIQLSTFKATFCNFYKIKNEELDFYSYEKTAEKKSA